MHHPLILASQSPRRRELLMQAGFAFNCLTADIDETILPEETPGHLVLRLARMKAEKIRREHPDCIILGADTVVALDGRIYGKPADLDEAGIMLRSFSGRTQEVLTGLCVLHPERKPFLRCVCSRITFRILTDETIRTYFSLVNPLDKAGAYGIQSHGELIVSRREGSLTNVIGLPVEDLPPWLTRECDTAHRD